eukprot:symbB.v1.2.004007.t1/scaffold225.1/size261367/8
MRLYAPFHKADILICSPLGLRQITGAEGERKREFDFLSSIEVCIVDRADVLRMQNWEHVQEVMQVVNRKPQGLGSIDISCLRHQLADGRAREFRQTVITSNGQCLDADALFKLSCTPVSTAAPEKSLAARLRAPQLGRSKKGGRTLDLDAEDEDIEAGMSLDMLKSMQKSASKVTGGSCRGIAKLLMASSAESLAEQLQDFQIQEEEFIEHEIFQRNCYEPLQPIEVPEPLIVDAGANVGLFAFWALNRWTTCRLICIEPLPPSVKILRENLSKAGDRALIVAAALGAKEEVAEFFYFPWAPGESTRHVHEAAEQRERLWVAAAESGVAAPPNLRKLATPQLQESFQCRVQRMSTLMRPLKTRKGQPAYVDLLKVDVEGDEEAVFQGIDAEDWPRIRQVVAEEMRICPRWYAIPVNFLSLIAVLYVLAAALKFGGVLPDLNEQHFVFAVIRYAFLIALPFLIFSAVSSVRSVQRLPADEAAMLIFRYWKDGRDDPARKSAKDLPEKFRGVFWMSTDPSPELCTNFEGASFDPSTRTMKLFPGDSYRWVWCDSCLGWAFYLFFAFVNPIYSLQVRWEEDYRKAYLPSILFGCFNIDWLTCSAMYIEQVDETGEEWARTSYVLGQSFRHGSYTLKKVIDQEGNCLPAFDDMILSLKEKRNIQGYVKPWGFVVEIRQQLPCHEEGYFAFIPESLRLFHIRAARRTKRGAPVESAEKRETRAALPEGTPLREATAFGISRQFFLHTPCESLAEQSDRLFETFETRYWRPLASSLEGLLVVATTYYNFLRLRRFLREEGASFSSIFEYSTPKAVGHARHHFFQNQKRLLLVTERFLWYRRFRLRGANYALFYGVPQTSEIYQEVLGAVRVPSQCNSMCLFTKHDAFALERLVGHERAKNMLTSTPGKVFVYS